MIFALEGAVEAVARLSATRYVGAMTATEHQRLQSICAAGLDAEGALGVAGRTTELQWPYAHIHERLCQASRLELTFPKRRSTCGRTILLVIRPFAIWRNGPSADALFRARWCGYRHCVTTACRLTDCGRSWKRHG